MKRDFTGVKMGRATVLGYHGKGNNYQSLWKCLCECGTEFLQPVTRLNKRQVKSCGCGHGLKIDDPITHEQLLALAKYKPLVGGFYARRKWHRLQVGQRLGCIDINCGYENVTLGGVVYYGHVLAWFYMKAEWPTSPVDHEDRDRGNNKWKNLRSSTGSQNNANHPVRKDSQSGYKGVTPYFRNKEFWKAYIIKKGKQCILGYERSPEAAARLYDAAAKEYYGEFARTNF